MRAMQITSQSGVSDLRCGLGQKWSMAANKSSTLRGFREVRVHSGLETLLPVSHHRVSGQPDDRSMAPDRRLSLSDGRGRLQAVHLWHLKVHENEVEPLLPQASSAALPVPVTTTEWPLFSRRRTARI